KLEYYGISSNSLALIKHYLTNRKQFSDCEIYKSELENITTEVPQGSNLGLFLFWIYINDL
ncbi:hypothetical protein CAPTEDRAFT_31793, partial [Capitella teleta]